MGREMRRVPADWVHPRDENGGYIPLYDRSFSGSSAKWKEEFLKWEAGLRPEHYVDGEWQWVPAEAWTYDARSKRTMEYWEWDGNPPDRESYRPEWPEETRTHFMMYETTTEGTPISPAFGSIEGLCRWCAENGASWFGDQTASYEEWMSVCTGKSSAFLVMVAPG